MFWMTLALLAIAGGILMRRRPRSSGENEEPWRASLRDTEDEQPLDLDEIRRAEDEWLADEPVENQEEWS